MPRFDGKWIRRRATAGEISQTAISRAPEKGQNGPHRIAASLFESGDLRPL